MKKSTKNEKLYEVKLSRWQMSVILDALETYERIGMGQFDIALKSSPSPISLRCINFNDHQRAEFGVIIDRLKEITFPELPKDASFSITAKDIPENCRVAYDMQQVFRHQLAWDVHPEGGITVEFDKPLRVSEEPLAKMVIWSKK